jgi:hypothetical protein
LGRAVLREREREREQNPGRSFIRKNQILFSG